MKFYAKPNIKTIYYGGSYHKSDNDICILSYICSNSYTPPTCKEGYEFCIWKYTI